jgi:Acetohydroxy acid isomeroreductase, NADPH-binding domain
MALIGYGSQGHGQGLNARDNGLKVIVGVRKDGESWRQALEDGWVCTVLIKSAYLPHDNFVERYLARPFFLLKRRLIAVPLS